MTKQTYDFDVILLLTISNQIFENANQSFSGCILKESWQTVFNWKCWKIFHIYGSSAEKRTGVWRCGIHFYRYCRLGKYLSDDDDDVTIWWNIFSDYDKPAFGEVFISFHAHSMFNDMQLL